MDLQTDHGLYWLSDLKQTTAQYDNMSLKKKEDEILLYPWFPKGMLIRVPPKKKFSIRIHGNTVTFPSDVRRSATASTNALCSILHLYSGLLKSGLGHYMVKKKNLTQITHAFEFSSWC